MKIPLCNFCIKSNILCQKCEEKVKTGKVSDLDIRIAKLLLEIENKYQTLQNVSFYNAYDINDFLVIVLGKGDLDKISLQRRAIMRGIGENVGRRIRILEKQGGQENF